MSFLSILLCKVTKKQNMLVPNPSYDLDYETIAIDDDDDVGDNAVPEFVKHIEAMPDEIDRILSLWTFSWSWGFVLSVGRC